MAELSKRSLPREAELRSAEVTVTLCESCLAPVSAPGWVTDVSAWCPCLGSMDPRRTLNRGEK